MTDQEHAAWERDHRSADGTYDAEMWGNPADREPTAASDLEAGSDEEVELRGLWLSRRMFGWIVGMPEVRSYEEWLAVLGMRLA